MRLDPLGDNISSVELLDHMGSDLTVVNAARVSFHKESDWLQLQDGSETLSMVDGKLIRYLASHNHWTPFAQCTVQLRLKMPIFVVREWFRHTVGFVRNEVSRRYVTDEPEFYIPDSWRLKHENKKQGSSDEIHEQSGAFSHGVRQTNERLSILYYDLLKCGVAPELARTILPQSMYTEFIETASLYAYAHLCHLRLSPDAQRETGAYALAVSNLIQPLFPVIWEALNVETN